MKTTADYSKSPCPKFDAVEDIKEFLGERYSIAYDGLKTIDSTEQFALWCSFAGIEGFPVEAFYDLIHGSGAWGAARAHHHTPQARALYAMHSLLQQAEKLLVADLAPANKVVRLQTLLIDGDDAIQAESAFKGAV